MGRRFIKRAESAAVFPEQGCWDQLLANIRRIANNEIKMAINRRQQEVVMMQPGACDHLCIIRREALLNQEAGDDIASLIKGLLVELKGND